MELLPKSGQKMGYLFWKKYRLFIYAFIGFIALNLILFLFIILFNNRVIFHKYNYVWNAHHYILDERQLTGKFKLVNGIAVWDAQWYLRIAGYGYPKNPQFVDIKNKSRLDGLTYAFFPLYPTLIKAFTFIIPNVELAAFSLTIILLVANFASLFFVISRLFTKQIAIKTIFLLFLFPFSIFYRSYFTESLFLLLLTWFVYFLVKKQFVASGALLGLMAITRPNGIFLSAVFLFFLARQFLKARMVGTVITSIALAIGPFLAWMHINLLQTGTPFYWYFVQSEWFVNEGIISNLISNLERVSRLASLPLHYFHGSKIDVLTAIILMFLLYLSYGRLKLELWLVSFVLWLFPLLVKDTMSYSRYQIVTFPIFIYLASVLKKDWYFLVLLVFAVLLLGISLFFVNWHWLG